MWEFLGPLILLILVGSNDSASIGSLYQNEYGSSSTGFDRSKPIYTQNVNKDFKSITYNLTITPNFHESTFDGRLLLRVTTKRKVSEIILSKHNYDVSAHIEGIESSDLNVTQEKHKLILKPNKPLKKNTEYVMSMSFKDLKIRNDKTGFYRSQWIYLTNFDTTHASKVFPCFDDPSVKSTFILKIDLTSDPEMKVLANSDLNMVENNISSFKNISKISVQNFGFAILKGFSSIPKSWNDDTLIRLHVRNKMDQFVFYAQKKVIEVMNKLRRTSGVEYQLKKLDVVAIPDNATHETSNLGLIFLPESSLLYTEGNQAVIEELKIIKSISRAIARMWLQNIATPSTWDQAWTREGLVKYYEYFASDDEKRKPDLMEEFLLEVHQKSMLGARLQLNNEEIMVNRAASIFRMLETYNSAGQHLVTSRANQFSSMEDLFALGNRTLANWLNCTGYPLLNVSFHQDYLDLSTKTFSKPLDISIEKENWEIPFELSNLDSEYSEVLLLNLNSSIVNISKTNNYSDLTIISRERISGYYRVNYDTKTWNEIVKVLNSNNHAKISPIDRSAILDDMLNLAGTGYLDYETLFKGLKYLKDETKYLPLKTVMNGLDYLLKVDHSETGDSNYIKLQKIREEVEETLNSFSIHTSEEDMNTIITEDDRLPDDTSTNTTATESNDSETTKNPPPLDDFTAHTTWPELQNTTIKDESFYNDTVINTTPRESNVSTTTQTPPSPNDHTTQAPGEGINTTITDGTSTNTTPREANQSETTDSINDITNNTPVEDNDTTIIGDDFSPDGTTTNTTSAESNDSETTKNPPPLDDFTTHTTWPEVQNTTVKDESFHNDTVINTTPRESNVSTTTRTPPFPNDHTTHASEEDINTTITNGTSTNTTPRDSNQSETTDSISDITNNTPVEVIDTTIIGDDFSPDGTTTKTTSAESNDSETTKNPPPLDDFTTHTTWPEVQNTTAKDESFHNDTVINTTPRESNVSTTTQTPPFPNDHTTHAPEEDINTTITDGTSTNTTPRESNQSETTDSISDITNNTPAEDIETTITEDESFPDDTTTNTFPTESNQPETTDSISDIITSTPREDIETTISGDESFPDDTTTNTTPRESNQPETTDSPTNSTSNTPMEDILTTTTESNFPSTGTTVDTNHEEQKNITTTVAYPLPSNSSTTTTPGVPNVSGTTAHPSFPVTESTTPEEQNNSGSTDGHLLPNDGLIDTTPGENNGDVIDTQTNDVTPTPQDNNTTPVMASYSMGTVPIVLSVVGVIAVLLFAYVMYVKFIKK